MTDEKIKIIEGNLVISKFNNDFKDNYGKWYSEQRKFLGYDEKELKYHSDWSWQIPVYSKLAKEMYAIKEFIKITQMDFGYIQAMKDNNPLIAFEIIVENLTWYNKNKNGK